MARLVWFVLLVCVQRCWSQDSSSTEVTRDESDPVALLLSSLRSLVENPGSPFEDGYEFRPLDEGHRREPMYGRPRQDYFQRIKENYEKLQKNIGSVLGDLSLPKSLFGVDVKTKEGSSTVDVKNPFFPVHVKVKTSSAQSLKEPVTQVPGFLDVFPSRKEAEKSTTKVGVSIPSLPIDIKVKVQPGESEGESTGGSGKVRPSSSVSAKVKVGDAVKVKVESESKMAKRVGMLPSNWISLGESSGGRGKRDATTVLKFATQDQIEVFSKTYYDFMADPNSEDDIGDVDVDIIDPVSSRLMSEVLYSEEAFDNMTKTAIKNLKWALDSDLAPSKVVDKLDEVAKLILSRRKPSTKIKRTPEDAARFQARRDASKLPVMLPKRQGESTRGNPDYETLEPPKETVLYAITKNGIPVQIRFGPEINNPYRFLHRMLAISQVVLNVQVKDVMEDGDSKAEEKIPPPVLHVDMSDRKQRSSFLRTLKQYKSEQVPRFGEE